MDLSTLLERCCSGDELAWEALVRQFQARIYGIAYHYVGNAEDARDLARVRHHPLLVVVLPLVGAILSQRARAEMVAALRVVDYVVTAEDGDVEKLVTGLRPVGFVRLEAAQARRYALWARQLIEHVHRRQSS